jgi:hypothetical protein
MRIASRIAAGMGSIWHGTSGMPSGLPSNWIYRLRSNPTYVAAHEALKRIWAPAFFALLFAYLGLSVISHLLYNIQDVAGLTCTESREPAAKGLARGESFALPIEFKTSDLCKATGVFLDGNGAKYYVKVEPLGSSAWSDAGIPVPIGGFSAAAQPAWYHRITLGLGVPLRRELTQDWFRIVLRYGGVGGEEVFIEPDPEDSVIETVIKPTRKGELFVFVNDAVIGVPGLYDFFYRHNQGGAKLTVTRR